MSPHWVFNRSLARVVSWFEAFMAVNHGDDDTSGVSVLVRQLRNAARDSRLPYEMPPRVRSRRAPSTLPAVKIGASATTDVAGAGVPKLAPPPQRSARLLCAPSAS